MKFTENNKKQDQDVGAKNSPEETSVPKKEITQIEKPATNIEDTLKSYPNLKVDIYNLIRRPDTNIQFQEFIKKISNQDYQDAMNLMNANLKIDIFKKLK